MNRRMKRVMAIGFLGCCVALAFPVGAQQPPAPPGGEQAGASATPGPAPVVTDERIDVSRIDQIIRGEERVFEGEKFTYDPANRRDPFISLAKGRQKEIEGPEKRPEGLPGMLVDELRLQGIIKTSSGTIAMVQGRDKLSYIIRVGTKLYDGEVKEIEPRKVVFKQQVNDPKAIKPFREVVREIAEK